MASANFDINVDKFHPETTNQHNITLTHIDFPETDFEQNSTQLKNITNIEKYVDDKFKDQGFYPAIHYGTPIGTFVLYLLLVVLVIKQCNKKCNHTEK